MKKINATLASIIGFVSFPLVAYAQTDLSTSFFRIGGFINSFRDGIVRSLITLFATMAMAAFFFGVVQYIWGFRNGEEKEITKGKTFMVWSLVALFVMFSVWGIIIFFQNTLGIGGNNRIIIPEVQVGGSTGNPASPLGGGSGGGCLLITDRDTCLNRGCGWDTVGSTCR